MSKKRIVTLVAIGIALIITGISLGLDYIQSNSKQSAVNTTAETEIATDVGKSSQPVSESINIISPNSASLLLQRWAAQYSTIQNAANLEISYPDNPESAISDIAIVGNVSERGYSYYVPVSAQAVAIVYNVPSFPDVPTGLRLNPELLLQIFDGNITEWDNSAIKELNQNQNIPHQHITVVHERLNNSSSYNLVKKYVLSTITWPDDSTIVSDPGELAAMVRKTPYSIGFVDFSYATQTKMTFAALSNLDDDYVTPSTDSISRAITSAIQMQDVSDVSLANGFAPPFINSSRLGNGSYPMVGLYYAAVNTSSIQDSDVRNATSDFIEWMIDNDGGQSVLPAVQYPPIYQNHDELMAYANMTLSRIGTLRLQQ